MTKEPFHDDATFCEIHRLTTICLEGDAPASAYELLSDLILRDPESLDAYVHYLSDSISLRCVVSSPIESGVMARALAGDVLFDAPAFWDVVPPTQGFPVAPVSLSTTNNNAFSSFSSGWPMAYLVATVICGFGLLVGSFTYVAQTASVAGTAVPTAEENFQSAAAMQSVGRITGIVDCEWGNPKMAPQNNAHVWLSQEFALTSGLLEITYNTGARVVLQGPVVYQVESTNGGHLSVGKLTAKLEKGSRNKVHGSKSELSPLPSPLFTITTPSATVTDLGTEFGVAVDKQGNTTSHVFQGRIKVQVASVGANAPGAWQVLRKDESVCVSIDDPSGKPTIHPTTVDPASFVRSEQYQQRSRTSESKAFDRWKAYSDRLRSDPAIAAYYDFQRRADSPAVLHARADSAPCELNGQIKDAIWASGQMPGKHALRFDGEKAYVKVDIPRRMTKMTLATWIAIDYIDDSAFACVLLTSYWPDWPQKRDGPENCTWQICRTGEVVFHTTNRFDWRTVPILPWQKWGRSRWHHLAVVVDPAARQMTHYLDGKKVDVGEVSDNLAVRIGSAKIGNWWPVDGHANRAFRGSMAELTILGRVMTPQEIAEMFEAGKP